MSAQSLLYQAARQFPTICHLFFTFKITSQAFCESDPVI
ncbi:hypothetical protein C357_05169 [Citreicella sp. 357]|nr:hypothetical protein C357_05169 [Citreicella sp. 357]